jgi:hypothetical protein
MPEGRPPENQTSPLRILEHWRRVAWPSRADLVRQDSGGGGIGFECGASGGRHGAKNLIIVATRKNRFEERWGFVHDPSRRFRKRYVCGRDLGGHPGQSQHFREIARESIRNVDRRVYMNSGRTSGSNLTLGALV